jgi:hypothetical protein
MPKPVPYRSLRRQPGPWRGNRLGQRWLGLVVRPRIALRRRNGGFSLIVIFLLVLSILTTTLALTSRTTGGLYAQSYQSKLRLAKDAAENGLVVVASEFNYPGNRTILGGGVVDPPIESDDWGTLGSYEIASVYVNQVVGGGSDPKDPDIFPCYIYGEGGGIGPRSDSNEDNNGALYYPSEWFPLFFNKTSTKRRFDLGNGQSYQLSSYKLYDANHNLRQVAPKDAISYLAIAVDGFYSPSTARTFPNVGDRIKPLDNFVGSSSDYVKYTIQREFQVVPRCCASGFGKVNGVEYGPGSKDSKDCLSIKYATEWILRSVSRTSAFNDLT